MKHLIITRSYGKVQVQDVDKIQTYLKENGLMNKKARLVALEEIIKTKDRVRISSLAKQFKVSQITIRNDLKELRENSTIILNHGEALFDRENSVRKSIAHRPQVLGSSEEKIARRVLEIIKPGQTIYLDDSAGSIYIAAHISLEANVSILTPEPRVIKTLMERVYKAPAIMLPSRIHIQDNRLVLHERAIEILENQRIGMAVFTINGIDGSLCTMEHASLVSNFTMVLPLADQTILCLSTTRMEINQQNPHILVIPTIFRETVKLLVDNEGTSALQDQLRQLPLPVFICGKGNMMRTLSGNNEKKVGFLYSVSSTSDAKTLGHSIERAISTGSQYTLIEAGVSDERQNILSRVQAMMAEHIDYLILYITNYETGHYITSRFSRKRIITISIDIALPNSTFFGVDNYHAGVFAGQHLLPYVSSQWNGKVDKIIVFGVQTAGPLAKQRISGIIDKLRNVTTIDDSHVVQFDFEMLRKMPGDQIARIVAPNLGKRNICISFNEKTTFLMDSMVPYLPYPENIIIIGHNYNDRIKSLMHAPGSRLLGCVHYHPEEYGEQLLDLIRSYEQLNTIPPFRYSTLTWINNPHQVEFAGSKSL